MIFVCDLSPVESLGLITIKPTATDIATKIPINRNILGFNFFLSDIPEPFKAKDL